jgi:hypothetical protein
VQTDVKAAAAILRQFERLPEGYNYFRLHPKGRGMLVARPDGIQPFTFVEEYLGEVHTGTTCVCTLKGHAASSSSSSRRVARCRLDHDRICSDVF